MERFRSLFPQLFVGGDIALRFLVKLIIIIAIAALVIVGLYMLTKWLKENYLIEHVHEGPNKDKIVNMLGDSFFMICLMVIVLSAIHFLGFEISLLLAALAFGLGFAFQDVLGNMFAGLVILANNDYKLGDIIEIDHENEDYFGRIEELNMRYVVIRTVDLRRVIVPNLVMITHAVRTYEIEDSVRFEVVCVLHYSSSVDTALRVITNSVNQVPIVNRPDLTVCTLQAMGDHGLEFMTYAYVDPKCGMTQKRIRALLSKYIYAGLLDAGISIAYPHSTMTFDSHDTNIVDMLTTV